MTRTFLLALSTVVCWGGLAASAHHSFAATYDEARTVQIEGKPRQRAPLAPRRGKRAHEVIGRRVGGVAEPAELAGNRRGQQAQIQRPAFQRPLERQQAGNLRTKLRFATRRRQLLHGPEAVAANQPGGMNHAVETAERAFRGDHSIAHLRRVGGVCPCSKSVRWVADEAVELPAPGVVHGG